MKPLVPDVVKIECAEDPRILFYHSLKGNHPRLAERGVVFVEGEQQVLRLFQSKLRIQGLFLQPEFLLRLQMDESYANRLAEVPEIFTAEKQLMAKIVGYRLHEGVMALAERPASVPLDALLGPIVALNGIVDPENVGSIARNSAAFGVGALLVDKCTADPLIRRAIRVSMGASLFLPVCYVEGLAEALVKLKRRFTVAAVELREDALPLSQFQWKRELVLVLGSERRGIDAEVLDACDTVIQIPQDGSTVNSLNVNAASAIVLQRLWQAIAD